MFCLRVLVLGLVVAVFAQDWNSYVNDVKQKINLERSIINSILPGSGANLYNADDRPPPSDMNENLEGDARGAVLVQINVYLGKASYDEDENTADLEVTFRQEWTDSRLIYRGRQDRLPEYVSLPLDQKIWLPDTFFSSTNEESRAAEARLQFIRFEPTSGHVTYSKRHTVETVCEPSTSAFPLSSKQECQLKIGSWSYSCLVLTVVFEQPCYGAIMYFFMPCILLVVASWLHFWIHGSWSVPRTVSAFIPFAIFILVLFFYERTGTSSMGAQTVWLLICVVLTFLSLLEYFLAICIGVTRPPQPQTQTSDAERPLLNAEDKGKFRSLPATTKLDYLSRFLFPVLFIIAIIIYLLCYLL